MEGNQPMLLQRWCHDVEATEEEHQRWVYVSQDRLH